MNNKNEDIEMFLIPENEKEKDKDIEQKEEDLNSEKILEEYKTDEKTLNDKNITVEDFLKFVREHARKDVYEYIRKLKESKEENNDEMPEDKKEELDKEEINLSTTIIKSRITGEEIDLTKFNIFDRIEQIYYHTGVKISVNDPLFASECDRGKNSFNSLLSVMSKNFVKEAKNKLGPDWRDKLLNEYAKSWNKIMSEEIEKKIEKGTDKLKEYKEKEELEKDNNSVSRAKVRMVNKDELKSLKNDLLDAKKTAILSKNGEHIIYMNDSASEEPKHVSR